MRLLVSSLDFDIGILSGRIVDGAGNPWYIGDIGIVGKKIAKIGKIEKGECKRAIDARGLYVCPGFIDIHTHSDISVIVYPGCDSTIRQGVTTHLVGNCGGSAAPLKGTHRDLWRHYWWSDYGDIEEWTWESFGDYLRFVEKGGVGHNVAALVGHSTVRTLVMGSSQGRPTSRELQAMKALVDESMRDGAFGLSTGLVYPPGCFAKTSEIVELCKVVSKYGGLYASHIRGERETVLEAIREAILIGEKGGVRVQISHNCPKIGAWGRTKETLGLVEDARRRGLDVTIDNDVHTDLGHLLGGSLPQYLQRLGREELVEHLKDKANRIRIRKDIAEDKDPAWGPAGLLKHGKFERIILMHVPGKKKLEGKSLAQVAKERGKSAFDTYFDLIVESKDRITALSDYMLEEDIRALLVHPLMMVSSDCSTRSTEASSGKYVQYYPCAFGEYPGIFERYVKKEPLLTIQEAVRKMTSFPAQKIGLFDRGLLRPGMVADITIIDMERIRDRATNLWPHECPFENYPHEYPEGVPYVIVNGKIAVEKSEQNKILAGEVFRHDWRK